MTWIAAGIAVLGAIIAVFAAIIVHIRAYDWDMRLEKVENRTLSNRTKLYNELGKTRDEVLHEVQAFLQENDSRSTGGDSDIGNAILMQLLAGGMGGQAPQPEPDNIDAIDGLLGSGGNGDN